MSRRILPPSQADVLRSFAERIERLERQKFPEAAPQPLPSGGGGGGAPTVAGGWIFLMSVEPNDPYADLLTEIVLPESASILVIVFADLATSDPTEWLIIPMVDDGTPVSGHAPSQRFAADGRAGMVYAATLGAGTWDVGCRAYGDSNTGAWSLSASVGVMIGADTGADSVTWV